MNGFVFNRAVSIAKKEVHHIWRDPFTLAMALALPVGLVIFFGYVFDFDARDIHLTVYDRDQTSMSRQLIQVFSASQYFRVKTDEKETDPLKLLQGEKAKGVIVIEPGFAKAIRRGQTASVQITLDGADNQTSAIIAGYLAGIYQAATKRILNAVPSPLAGEGRERGVGALRSTPLRGHEIQLQTRFLFNTDLNSRWFIVPGLTVVVVGILSILLTALTVAREWETGSMELLLSTPVQPLEIIVGKLAPYTALGLGGVVLVYIAARAGFGVPFKGSHLLFVITCLMFLATTLSQGLVISVITRQQQLAMQLANISGMLPALLLSGFIFPLESMPMFFRVLTSIIPAKWFMMICRGLFLKDANIFDLAKPLIALATLNVLFLFVAARKFKKDLEP